MLHIQILHIKNNMAVDTAYKTGNSALLQILYTRIAFGGI